VFPVLFLNLFGLHDVDRGSIQSGFDVRRVMFSATFLCRAKRLGPADVRKPVPEAEGMGIFRLRIRVRMLGARNCRWDFQVSFDLPRLPPAYRQGNCGLLGLGPAHQRVLHWYGLLK
jgi:hypothetical protein